MKKLLLTLSFAFLLCSINYAQDTIRLKGITKNPNSDRYKIVTDRPPQAVYVELGGELGNITINYDKRFSRRLDGLGLRLGIGRSSNFGNFVINSEVNYLIGNNRKGRFFEFGLGHTFYSEYRSYYSEHNKRSNQTLQFSLGYRSQPIQGGFFFRGGLCPIVIGGNESAAVYIGLGYNF